MEKKLFLADPNISCGRDEKVYEQIVDIVRNSEHVTLISYEPDLSFNRTVINIMGEAEPLTDVLVAICARSKELIDMRRHVGAHPRMGAMDVSSVYPFRNATLEDTIQLTRAIALRVFEEVHIPVYLSGHSSRTPFRSVLQNLRKGQYEGLSQLLLEIKNDPAREEEYISRKPDFSADGLLHETYGASVFCTEQDFPAFYNIFIDTEDVTIAKKIAKALRGASGGFSTISAIGIKFEDRPGTVVSIDISNTNLTPIYRPFEFVRQEAMAYGVNVIASELVGIVHLDSIVNCASRMLQLRNFDASRIVEHHLMKE